MLSKLRKWLLTKPPPNAMFFIRIRSLARIFHRYFGHKWYSQPEHCGVRKCTICGEEQWMIIKDFTGKQKWHTRYQ